MTLLDRNSKRRAFVIEAFAAAGGGYMNYRIAKILAQNFDTEVFIVQLHGECASTSYFEYDIEFPTITLGQLFELSTPNDILVMSPSNSHLWLGSRLPCKKLMYVQGFNTFTTLDARFDAYVAVSTFCQKFLELVYGIASPVIPAYLPPSEVPAQSWSNRDPNRVLVSLKGDPELAWLTLETISRNVRDRVGEVEFEDLRVKGPIPRHVLLEKLSRARFLLTLSPAEGFGLIPLEAMKYGVAVTGYHAMGGTDYMVHGKNSACEKFGDPEPIADNLVRFMREPAWAEALGQGGAETAARYSEEAFVDRWTRYLHGLLRS